MDKFWKAALAVGGIGTVGAFVFYSLYKDWLQLDIFKQLTSTQTFYLMVLFLSLVFLAACTMMVLWYLQQNGRKPGKPGIEIGIDEGWSFRKTAEAIVAEQGLVLRNVGFNLEELDTLIKPQTLRANNTAQALTNLRLIAKSPIRDYSVNFVDESVFELKVK